jgi:tetratricopeptide (TPR) repeat protein
VTHRREHIEPAELPPGRDEIERLVTLLILLIGLVGALTAYLETQASNRESIADRNAKFALLDRTASQLELTSRTRVKAVASGLQADERARASAFASSGKDVLAQAEARASARAARAISGDARLTSDANIYPIWREMSLHEQYAKAYERQRDGYTAQARRFITVITDLAVGLFLLGLVPTVPAGARRPFLVLAIGIGLFAVGWGAYIWNSGPGSPNRKAIEAFANGEVAAWEDSLAPYTRAIRLDPKFADAYVKRAGVHFHFERYASALADYKEATTLDERNFSAWNALGVSYWLLHKYKLALDAIEHAADLNPKNVTISFNRLEGIYIVQGATDEYQRQRHEYLAKALRPLGPLRRTELWSDLDDFATSAVDDPNIRPKLIRLCRDLVGHAMSDLHMQYATDDAGKRSLKLATYDCSRLPRPTDVAPS